MAKTKAQKKDIMENLEKKIDNAKSIVFTNFDKLSVEENNEIRNRLKEENSEYFVAKKTLLGLALNKKDIKDVNVKSFEGRVAAIFGYEDEVAPAKIINDFRKKMEDKLNFLGGVMEGKSLDKEQVSALAELPSKPELYAKIVGSLNAPISGFVNAMAGNLRNLVYVLKAIEEKKQ